ncbi:MAG: hypothetical protein H6Q14_1632 [Bacteroidetes bacterium]|nr:hypothetical protein [Bacteroidota bacterium]
MFFPDTIDLSESEKYVLAVRLQTGSFSFAIYQPGKNDAYVYRGTSFKSDIPYLQQLKRTIFDLNFLTQAFLRTWVEIVSPRHTLVPTLFFDPKEKDNYLDKTFSVEKGQDQVLSEGIGLDNDKQLVFDVDKDVYEFLSRNLFSPVFTHHVASLQRLFNLNSGKTELFSRMYLYFSGNQVDVFVTRNGEIQTIQSFTNESEQNLLYFVINIWKAFDMSQLNDRLFLSGDSNKYGKLIPLFSKYIQYVEQKGAPSEAFLLGDDAVKTPIDLLALLL